MDFLLHAKGFVLFAELFIKSSLICSLVLILIRLFPKQSAAFRHIVLGVAVIGLLILPFTLAFGPGWNTGIPQLQPQSTVEKTVNTDFKPTHRTRHKILSLPSERTALSVPIAQPKTVIWQSLGKNASYGLIFIWVLGIVFFIAIVFIGIYGTSRLTRKGVPVEGYPWKQLLLFFLSLSPMRRKVRVIQSARCVVPMTCGLISPAVVVPHQSAAWSFEQCSSVLFHELAHVKRHDFPVRILARLTCALYWFNPLCWEVYRTLKREQEKACDEMVIQIGIKPSRYASHLLEMRRTLENKQQLPTAALGIADAAEFKERLVHILKNQINIKEVKVKTKIFILVIGMMVILFIGMAKADSVVASYPTDDKKLEKNSVDFEKVIKKLEIQMLEVEKAIDAQKTMIGQLGEDERNEKSEHLELKLEKILEQIEATSDKIEESLESDPPPNEETLQKLQGKLDKLMDMEQALEKKGSEWEEIVVKLSGEEARVESEQMKRLEEESKKMELESFKLEKEARKLELESRKLDEQSRLLEAKQNEEADINTQKKLEEASKNLEKEAEKLELEAQKLEEEARMLEEKSEALESKMEQLEPLEPLAPLAPLEPLAPLAPLAPLTPLEKLGGEEHEFQELIVADQKSLKMKDSRMVSTFIAEGSFSKAQVDRFKQAVATLRAGLPASFEVVVDVNEEMNRVSIYCPQQEPKSSPQLKQQITDSFKKYQTILNKSQGNEEVDFIKIIKE